jgi:hypothetical protein
MRKLFLHVGFAKCGSTSLQAALSRAPGILFPTSGNHGGEHLAFALRIRGIDEWTRQYFDQPWVDRESVRLMEEIEAGTGTVVLSSERLAGCAPEEIERIAAGLSNFEVHVVIVRREIKSYVSSTWRYAVFHHDFGESYEIFADRLRNFTFDQIENKFSAFFQTHWFSMDSPNYVEEIGALLGTKLDISRLNVGVPMAFAELLQKTHALMGSKEFKKRFDKKTKRFMLAAWNGNAKTQIEPPDVPLF